MYIIPATVLLEIYEDAVKLARSRGKKTGEDFGEELFEIAKKKGVYNQIQFIGVSKQDASMLTGNLREEGKKILNLNEEMDKRSKDGRGKEE